MGLLAILNGKMRSALVLFLFLVSATFAEAASLYIDPAFPELYRGDTVELSVRLDTNEEIRECVNAVEGVISYSDNISPVDISLGDSIFSIWVERPTINEENRTISFAGGIPNGYCGRVEGDPRLTNTLFSIIVRLPGFTIGPSSTDGPGQVNFTEQTLVYLNDGLGTQVVPNTFDSEITLFSEPGASQQSPWTDRVAADDIPPEEFSITPVLIGGQWHASFNTTDKQTGVDEYQIIEEPLERFWSFEWGRADAPWVTTRSPHRLRDQSLNSTIRVRAIDKAGNEYIATLVPDESLRTRALSEYIYIGMAVLGGLVLLLVLVLVGALLWRRRKAQVAATEEEEIEEYDDEE